MKKEKNKFGDEPYTYLDWIRTFAWIDEDVDIAAKQYQRLAHTCERCPFSLLRKKGKCYKHTDPWCNNWYKKVIDRILDRDGSQAEIDRIDRLCEARTQQCREFLREFLQCEVDGDNLAKIIEKYL